MGWSLLYPGRILPGKDPLPIGQVAGLIPGPVWVIAENVATTWIGSTDGPALREWLYCLRISDYALLAHVVY